MNEKAYNINGGREVSTVKRVRGTQNENRKVFIKC